MSEPWHSLPEPLADDVARCWHSVFPDGVPGWLISDDEISEAVVADALSRSLFLRQTLERHPEQVLTLLESRLLTEPTTPEYLKQRWQDYLN